MWYLSNEFLEFQKAFHLAVFLLKHWFSPVRKIQTKPNQTKTPPSETNPKNTSTYCVEAWFVHPCQPPAPTRAAETGPWDICRDSSAWSVLITLGFSIAKFCIASYSKGQCFTRSLAQHVIPDLTGVISWQIHQTARESWAVSWKAQTLLVSPEIERVKKGQDSSLPRWAGSVLSPDHGVFILWA